MARAAQPGEGGGRVSWFAEDALSALISWALWCFLFGMPFRAYNIVAVLFLLSVLRYLREVEGLYLTRWIWERGPWISIM